MPLTAPSGPFWWKERTDLLQQNQQAQSEGAIWSGPNKCLDARVIINLGL